MKKILPVVILLAAIAAGVFLLMRNQPDAQPKPGRSAELAPAETVVFLEIPDVVRTMKRWEETALAKIANEPEWKAFSAKFGDFVFTNSQDPGGKMLFEVLSQIKEADPAGLFVAMSGPEKPQPTVVGGLPYRGKISAVKTAIEKLRGLILTGASAPKSEIVKFEGTDIEVITAQTTTYVFAYRDNWFFFGSELEAMKGLLQRYANAPGAAKGLSTDAAYANAIKQATPEADFTVFVNTRKMVDANPAVKTQMPPILLNMVPEEIVYSMKMDGPLMRDRIYFRIPKAPKLAAMGNRLLGFTNENSFAYGSFSVAGWEPIIREIFAEIIKTDRDGSMLKDFKEKGLTLDDILVAFGPEGSLHSDWQAGLPYPDAFAAVEVRNLEKARKFAELIVGGTTSMGKMSQKEEDGTTFWTLAAGLGIAQPTMALNDKYLVFGWNYTSTVAALRQMKTSAPGIGKSATYQAAIKTVPAPTTGIFYMDAKVLFERLYEQYKPMLGNLITSNEEASKYLDPAKLPQTATIAKHLVPTVLVYADAPEGIAIEGSGTVAMYPTFVPSLGLALVGFRAAPSFTPPPPVTGGTQAIPPSPSRQRVTPIPSDPEPEPVPPAPQPAPPQ